MPTPRERLLLLFEAEHPETAVRSEADRAAKDDAIRRTFGLEPARFRVLVAELLSSGHRNAA